MDNTITCVGIDSQFLDAIQDLANEEKEVVSFKKVQLTVAKDPVKFDGKRVTFTITADADIPRVSETKVENKLLDRETKVLSLGQKAAKISSLTLASLGLAGGGLTGFLLAEKISFLSKIGLVAAGLCKSGLVIAGGGIGCLFVGATTKALSFLLHKCKGSHEDHVEENTESSSTPVDFSTLNAIEKIVTPELRKEMDWSPVSKAPASLFSPNLMEISTPERRTSRKSLKK